MTRGALYRTLDRLTDKGFVVWEDEPSDVPERGGHPMRRLQVTAAGLAAVRQARDVLTQFFEGSEAADCSYATQPLNDRECLEHRDNNHGVEASTKSL